MNHECTMADIQAHPVNAVLLSWLHGRADVTVVLEASCEILRGFSDDLPGCVCMPCHGTALLAAPKGILFAAAVDQDAVAFRLPENQWLTAHAAGATHRPELGAAWMSFPLTGPDAMADRWMQELRYWCVIAHTSAVNLDV